MDDILKNLTRGLKATQKSLAEAESRHVRREDELQSVARELEEARKAIEHAHREWIAALDVLEDPVFLHDRDYRILRCNRAYQKCAGLSFRQIVGQPYYEIFPKTHAPLRHCQDELNTLSETKGEEVTVDGVIYRSRSFSVTDEQGNYLSSIHTMEDITERKRSELMLVEEKTFSETLIRSLPDLFYVLDQQGNFLRWSDNTANLLGLTPEQMLQTNALAFIHDEDKEHIARKLQEAFATGSTTAEARVAALRGVRHYTFTAVRIETRFGKNILGIGIDITERKQAEEHLGIFRALLDNSSDAIEVVDPATLRFLDVNETECRELGYTREELLTMRALDIDSKFDEQSGKSIADRIEQTKSALFESMHRRKDGSTFPVEIYTKSIELDKPYLLSIVRNITERKQHETEMRKLNRALALLSQCNTLLVHASNEQEILSDICKLAVESGGYLMAWVGFAEQDENRTVRPVAQSGYEEGYLEGVKVTWDDTELGRGPTGTAIRTGQTVVNQNILTNPDMKPWMEAALRRGYQASIALPLIDNTRTFGALTVYALEPDAFTDEEVKLLEELASDLAYGITALRTRRAHEQHAAILRQSLEQSIQTIADTVESRDPYTAGHQRRVANLATAIAGEMGLPEEQVNGIHLASIVHDVGKIHIPAEILSKPGRLSPIELELVKTHAQAGYDILKNVKFPWPIADIILQHHERLDGSGYPQGLKGEQILPEARILAVADVVESMISHRPYRPGLGKDTAFDEIRKNRGVLYDAAVVDACLKLFAEEGYQLPEP